MCYSQLFGKEDKDQNPHQKRSRTWGPVKKGSLTQLLTYVSSWRRKKHVQKYLLKHREKIWNSHRVLKRDCTMLKEDSYMPCTTDLERSKTEDPCDPRLGRSIKTSQIKKLPKAAAREL